MLYVDIYGLVSYQQRKVIEILNFRKDKSGLAKIFKQE
jgi:hypothetical protein